MIGKKGLRDLVTSSQAAHGKKEKEKHRRGGRRNKKEKQRRGGRRNEKETQERKIAGKFG